MILESISIWNEADVAYLKVMPRSLSRGAEETDRKSQTF
jgi:hypothetical protein